MFKFWGWLVGWLVGLVWDGFSHSALENEIYSKIWQEAAENGMSVTASNAVVSLSVNFDQISAHGSCFFLLLNLPFGFFDQVVFTTCFSFGLFVHLPLTFTHDTQSLSLSLSPFIIFRLVGWLVRHCS